MSLFFIDNNKFLSFREYILSEAIQPRSINFGTDLKNKQWYSVESSFNSSRALHYTFFKTNEYYYFVGLEDNGEISFDSSIEFDLEKGNDVEYVSEIFDGSRKKTKEFLKMFGYIVFIILAGTEKYNIKKIKFEPADPTLGSAYTSIVNNKFLNKTLESYGFEYKGLIDQFFQYQQKGTN